MAFHWKVEYSLNNKNNNDANAVKNNLNTSLSSKTIWATITANKRTGKVVVGNYLLDNQTDADNFYTDCATEYNGANNRSPSKIHKHDCGHATNDGPGDGLCDILTVTESSK